MLNMPECICRWKTSTHLHCSAQSQPSDTLYAGVRRFGSFTAILTCETVNGVGANLQRQLPTIQHHLLQRVFLHCQIFLGFLSCCQEMFKDVRQETLADFLLDEDIAGGCGDVVGGIDRLHLVQGALEDASSVTEVPGLHDGGVQRGKVQRGDGFWVVPGLGVEDRGPGELVACAGWHVRHHVILLRCPETEK